MMEEIHKVTLEIPNEYGVILKRYCNSILTDKDKFYGLAFWKVSNMLNCRIMDVVEFKRFIVLDISKELSLLDDTVQKSVEESKQVLIESFKHLMGYYNNLYEDNFLGFSIWKHAVFSSLRTRIRVEYGRD